MEYWLDKPISEGGLHLSRYYASLILTGFIILFILVFPQRAGRVSPGRIRRVMIEKGLAPLYAYFRWGIPGPAPAYRFSRLRSGPRTYLIDRTAPAHLGEFLPLICVRFRRFSCPDLLSEYFRNRRGLDP